MRSSRTGRRIRMDDNDRCTRMDSASSDCDAFSTFFKKETLD